MAGINEIAFEIEAKREQAESTMRAKVVEIRSELNSLIEALNMNQTPASFGTGAISAQAVTELNMAAATFRMTTFVNLVIDA